MNIVNHDWSVSRPARGGGQGGQNTWGPDWFRGPRNFDNTSGHCATVKRVGGPVMRNHLLVLGPEHGSRRPWSV